MDDATTFGVMLLVTGAFGLFAVLSNRLTTRVPIPTPLFFLVAAAVMSDFVPYVHGLPEHVVDRIVTVALLAILFSGGMGIGARRFREAAAPIVITGVVGTFLTVAATAVLVHLVFGWSWFVATLVGTAVAPTDPATVFSVLGQREIAGRSSTILEGESGANDPVGIALMASLVVAGELTWGSVAEVGGQFLLQMVIGAGAGLAGGVALLAFMRRLPLPSAALYPLRTMFCLPVIYGLATVAHGSGFLAVFVAGIVLGDARAPYKRETERFHEVLASLGEIVAFTVLGLTISLRDLVKPDVLVPGLVIGVGLAVVIRPVFVGLCLLPARLARNERIFVLASGLKGAVPILLAGFVLRANIADSHRIYEIVVDVVLFSVLVQGTMVPWLVTRLRLPAEVHEPEPWSLGVRLRDEPQGVHRFRVAAGSPADGTPVAELSEMSSGAWISLVVRNAELVNVTGDTQLQAGDYVTVLAQDADHGELQGVFEQPQDTSA